MAIPFDKAIAQMGMNWIIFIWKVLPGWLYTVYMLLCFVTFFPANSCFYFFLLYSSMEKIKFCFSSAWCWLYPPCVVSCDLTLNFSPPPCLVVKKLCNQSLCLLKHFSPVFLGVWPLDHLTPMCDTEIGTDITSVSLVLYSVNPTHLVF